MEIKTLIGLAVSARERAYAPYSRFCVGAALLAKNGQVFTGCNIENAAYTPSVCAERTAFFQAVSRGVREFEAICIVGGPAGGELSQTAPCGVCRQVMMEFCDPETFRVILAVSETQWTEYRLCELFPVSFSPENLRTEGGTGQ